jgi:hypothetical protein
MLRRLREPAPPVAAKLRASAAGSSPMSQRPRKARVAAPHKGLYANYFEVGQTACEFVIDFGQRYRGQPPSACHTRIVTSPTYARALLQTLTQAVEEYRQRFGEAK